MSATKMPIEHALARTTARIMAGPKGGASTSTGTGFFYQVSHPTAGIAKILLVTNKHVVRSAEVVQFVISTAKSVGTLDEYHQPVGRQDHNLSVDLAGNVYSHPDPEIDLCGIDVTVPVGRAQVAGGQIRAMYINSTWLVATSDKPQVRDVEQVLVVGYPHGLWDGHNNMPIVRLGTTATHLLSNYQGKKHFLVDVAAFAGSSGSPVFSYEAPLFRNASGDYSPGTKVQFVGVIWGVLENTTTGELKIADVPAVLTPIPAIKTSLNLASAIHGDAVLALDELVFPGISKALGRA